MAKKIYDLCAKLRSYQDSYGKNKNVYENIGSLMQSDDGSSFIILKRYINFAALPNTENSDTVLVSLFSTERKQNNFSNNNENPSVWNGGNFNQNMQGFNNLNSEDNSEPKQIPF